MYYIYIIRCKDNSLYTGITNDIERRMNEHIFKTKKCAKYTLRHTAIKLEKAWKTENRSFASKLEYNLKKISKLKKEELIINKTSIYNLFNEKIECDKYIEV